MDDITLEVSAANRGLRDRPDTEMIAFNEAATGYTDGALLCITRPWNRRRATRRAVRLDLGGCSYIDRLWVREYQRRPGLGRQLLAAAEQEIRDRRPAALRQSERAGRGAAATRPRAPP